MTAFTLMAQAVTLANAGNASPQLTFTTEFTLTSAASLTGIWFYSPAGAAGLPDQCCLFDTATMAQVAGTANLSPSWSGAAASGWVKCSYSPVALTSGHTYLVAVHVPPGSADGYGKTLSFWTTGFGGSGIVSGPLSAPNFSTSTLQGAVSSGQVSLTYPTITESGSYFGVDVEVTTSGGTARTATASLAVAPSFTASRTAGRNRAASLAVSPSLSASRSQGHARTGTLTVQPSLSAARTRGAYRSASLLASPGFTASRTLGHARQAGLLIQPGFTATRSQGHARTGLLALSPGLAAVASHGHARSGSLLVSPSFRAVPSGGSALPILVSLGRARWLWALGMARNSEGASMTSLSQAAISTQPVQVQVTVITETGEPYNPTGDPVSVAFVPQAYPPASPQDGDWITASWATDTSGNCWATALVGPANGGTALAAGSYVAWVRVTDNPAVPEEPGPVLLIF